MIEDGENVERNSSEEIESQGKTCNSKNPVKFFHQGPFCQ